MMSRRPSMLSVCCVSSAFLLGSVAWPVSVTRAGTMSGGASEWTQVLNNIALLQQIVHAIQAVVQLKKQVEYMAKSTRDFANSGFSNTDSILNGFSSVLSQTSSIIYAGQSLHTMWEQIHPGRVAPGQLGLTDADAYRKIDTGVQNAVAKTLQVLDAQGPKGSANDQEIFENLKSKMETAEGQLQAAKAGNELLLEIVRQLRLLREVVIANAQMMGEAVSADAQRHQFEDAIRERARFTGKYQSKSPIDWSQK